MIPRDWKAWPGCEIHDGHWDVACFACAYKLYDRLAAYTDKTYVDRLEERAASLEAKLVQDSALKISGAMVMKAAFLRAGIEVLTPEDEEEKRRVQVRLMGQFIDPTELIRTAEAHP